MIHPADSRQSRSRRWIAIAALAAAQAGLVTRAQLLALRIASSTIDELVVSGRLHVVYRGVYRLGHSVAAPYSNEMAAVLASGPDARLSHRSALELRGYLEPRPDLWLQVTVPGRRVPGANRLRIHHTDAFAPDELDVVNGVPTTSAARSVIDFAAQAPVWEVTKAYEEGIIQDAFDRDEMIRLLVRHRGRRGITKVRALVDRDAPPSVTIEEAHRRLLELIRSSRLPHPRTEVQLGSYRADILWPDAKLIVEMDGAAFHNQAFRIERDKRRDGELAAQGYLTIRVTWKELTQNPTAVISRISRTYALRTSAAA